MPQASQMNKEKLRQRMKQTLLLEHELHKQQFLSASSLYVKLNIFEYGASEHYLIDVKVATDRISL